MDASARLWRADTGELVAVLRGHKEGITCLAFSPDAPHPRHRQHR
jgi:WD40 repeat protein